MFGSGAAQTDTELAVVAVEKRLARKLAVTLAMILATWPMHCWGKQPARTSRALRTPMDS